MSPEKLRQFGVSVYRLVQKAGQFVIIFPQSYVASISCGYSVSESIKFATDDWLPLGYKAAQVVTCRLSIQQVFETITIHN